MAEYLLWFAMAFVSVCMWFDIGRFGQEHLPLLTKIVLQVFLLVISGLAYVVSRTHHGPPDVNS